MNSFIRHRSWDRGRIRCALADAIASIALRRPSPCPGTWVLATILIAAVRLVLASVDAQEVLPAPAAFLPRSAAAAEHPLAAGSGVPEVTSAATAGVPEVAPAATVGVPGFAAGGSDIAAGAVTFPHTCLVVIPEGPAPEGGWPVFLLLHGYGTNKEDFDELARVVSGRGAAAIAVDAPGEIGGGRRSWGREIDATHAYLQEQIAPLRADPRFDLEPIHVGGFSQGGIRSLLLAAYYPEEYGGVLSISPAGGDWPDSPRASNYVHPMRLVYGTAENSGILQTAGHAVEFWKQWGQAWEVFTHPGGHQFPGDWATVLGDGAAWILEESRANGAAR